MKYDSFISEIRRCYCVILKNKKISNTDRNLFYNLEELNDSFLCS